MLFRVMSFCYNAIMAGKLVLTIWLAFFSVVTRGEVTVVRVIPVNDPRLPALSVEETTKLLDVAATMIRRSYDREVKFELQPAEALPKWFDDRWAKISPYEIPKEYRADLFDEDLSRFEQATVNACKLYGTVDQLKLLLDEDRRGVVTNIPSAAKALLEQYKANRAKVRDMTLGDGSKLVAKENWRTFSYSNWNALVANAPDVTIPELYLTNVLLIDDFLADPAPHSLASSLAYGFMFPTTNRTVVTTYPMLASSSELVPVIFRSLPDEQRRLLVPYTIGHEIGTHYLMQVWDAYGKDAGLARPMRAVDDPSIISSYNEWPRARVDLRKVDLAQQRFGVLTHRLDIAIARKDRAAAETVIRELENTEPWTKETLERLEEFADRYNATKWD